MSIAENFLDAIAPLLPDKESLDQLIYAAKQPLGKSISLVTHRRPQDMQAHDTTNTIRNSCKETRTLQEHPQLALHDQYYVDRLERDIPLGKTRQHLCGFFYIQELAAGLPATILDIPEQGIVLDMCAAPGGKTVQLANRLLNNVSGTAKAPGLVWANDMNSKRLSTWATNIKRTGMYNTVATRMDGSVFGNLLPEFFDAIVADVPCSGEGTYYKSSSALDWRNQSEIMQLQHTQEHLLISALKALKIGGSLVYSTCTLNHWENEAMVARVLEKYSDACEIDHITLQGTASGCAYYGDTQILPEDIAEKLVRCWPHQQKTGGFFVSKRRKTGPIYSGSQSKRLKGKTKRKHHINQSQIHQNASLTKSVHIYLKETFGIQLPKHRYLFVQNGKYIYVCSPRVKDFLHEHKRYQVGIPILKPIRNGFVPTHHVGQLRGSIATQNTMEVPCERLQEYTQHRELSVPHPTPPGYHIVRYQGEGVSVTKIHNNLAKNKFIKR